MNTFFSNSDIDDLHALFACIDNTSLNGTDTSSSIESFCRHTMEMQDDNVKHVASVCVYPVEIETCKRVLGGSGINIASVAGGFPSGQLPLHLKMEEVRYAVEHGADEVDFVINRGLFLMNEKNALYDEVASAKDSCGKAILKVILETGELGGSDAIYNASMIALDAGADFIKTSTGKIPVGATIEAATTMLRAIADYQKKSGRLAGFKAAGGIRTPTDALLYYREAKKIFRFEKAFNKHFRIGASRLTDELFNVLSDKSK